MKPLLVTILLVTSSWVMAQDLVSVSAPIAVMDQGSAIPATAPSHDPLSFLVQPGVNQVIVVAQGHLNRIVTPFPAPAVRTASTAEVKVVDNILYVAPADSTPVTLFVTPKGREDLALSLTLAPRLVPPVDVSLQVSTELAIATSDGDARDWEESQPYVETLTDVLRALALEQLPDGYAFETIGGNPLQSLCRQPGVRYSTAQMVRGHNILVLIGLAQLTGSTSIEFDERACSTDGVLAVAGWPSVALHPNQPIELFVAVEPQHASGQGRPRRPSLLTGRVER